MGIIIHTAYMWYNCKEKKGMIFIKFRIVFSLIGDIGNKGFGYVLYLKLCYLCGCFNNYSLNCTINYTLVYTLYFIR